ncbi:MAG: GNAT family N-acetyltransferase [Bacteroidota bacterium]
MDEKTVLKVYDLLDFTSMQPLPELITTKRLYLRRPGMADAITIFERWGTDAEVAKYTSWRPHEKVDTLECWLGEIIPAWLDGTCYTYAICLRGDDRPIGMIEANPEQGFRVLMGYVLARAYWNQGFMTEALQTFVDELFKQPTIHRVYAFCDIDNLASAAVMRKVGMQEEGILRKYFIHPNISEEPRDVLLLAKTR